MFQLKKYAIDVDFCYSTIADKSKNYAIRPRRQHVWLDLSRLVFILSFCSSKNRSFALPKFIVFQVCDSQLISQRVNKNKFKFIINYIRQARVQ